MTVKIKIKSILMKENRPFLFVDSRENVGRLISETFNLSFHPEKYLFLQILSILSTSFFFFFLKRKKYICLNAEHYFSEFQSTEFMPRDFFFYIISELQASSKVIRSTDFCQISPCYFI